MLDTSQIETRYAKSGELSIAYQVFGAGEVNLVFIPGWASNVENIWTLSEFAAFADKLAQFARVILLDRRGTGLSDPVVNPPTLEERMDDVRAVIDAAGWDRAVIWGVSEGGPMAMMFAATYPHRVPALVLYGTFARFSRADDYPHGYPREVNEQWVAALETTWGTGELSRSFAPSLVADVAVMRNLARLERMAMSPGTARKLFGLLTQTDVRHVLPAIRVPTLILHRAGDQPVRVGHARYLAERIAGAKYIELAGNDHMPFFGNVDAILDEVREFLTGERAAPDSDRTLTTILFCDIVDSTKRATELGDREWKQLLSRFYALADEKLHHFRVAQARHRRGWFVRRVRWSSACRALRRGAGRRGATAGGAAAGGSAHRGMRGAWREVQRDRSSPWRACGISGGTRPGARLVDSEGPRRRFRTPFRGPRAAHAQRGAGPVASFWRCAHMNERVPPNNGLQATRRERRAPEAGR